MTTTAEQAMRGALQARLLTLGWDAARTAFEGKLFTPVAGQAYQEVTTQFFDPEAITLAGSDMARGLFQIRIMWPLEDVRANGIGAPGDRAATIKAGFPRNLLLTGAGGAKVRITRSPVITRAPAQGDRDVTIVRMRFSDR